MCVVYEYITDSSPLALRELTPELDTLWKRSADIHNKQKSKQKVLER